VTIAQGSSSATFYLTPGSTGARNVSITTSPALTYSGSPIAYAASTTYTLTGPTSGTVGTASSNFTVTPAAAVTSDTITLSNGSGGGTFAPSSLSWSASSAAKTFTYTAASSGSKSLAATSGDGYAVTGSPASFAAGAAAATSYTLTGPSSGTAGQASSAFTVQPNGTYTGTVTVAESGAGLSGSQALTWSNSAAAQTFTVTPPAAGTVTLTPSNSGSLSNPAALSYVATAAATTWAFRSGVQGLAPGLATVGYRVIARDGSVYRARTTSGVVEVVAGSGIYAADVPLPFSGAYHVIWDDGGTPPRYAADDYCPRAVEVTGLNELQVLSLLLAKSAGAADGFTSSGGSGHFHGPDGTVRITGQVDGYGNRSNVTLSPPA
jgi:hypothetical protein